MGSTRSSIPCRLVIPESIDVANLKVAFYTDNGTVSPTAEVEASVRSAADAISDLGADVVEDLPRGNH